MAMQKTVLFQGSRERLRRMVARYHGVFLDNQEFEIPWQSVCYKPLHRRTFRIRCRYEKEDIGYRITYRITPSGWSWLRIAAVSGLWIWAAVWAWDPAEPAGTIAALALAAVGILTDFWQLRDCEEEFLRRFTAVTK